MDALVKPFQKFGKIISKAIAPREYEVEAETLHGVDSKPLQMEPHPEQLEHASSPMQHREQYMKAVVSTSQFDPVHHRNSIGQSSLDLDDEKEGKTGKEEIPKFDENTPVDILLERIDYLETLLRSEQAKSLALEFQLNELEVKYQHVFRVAHETFYVKILRKIQSCFYVYERAPS